MDNAEDWEEKAVEILERFLEGMQDDRQFTIPVDALTENDDSYYPDNWSYVYTTRGQKLATRMIGRLNKIAERRFGFDIAFGFDISSHLYQEE